MIRYRTIAAASAFAYGLGFFLGSVTHAQQPADAGIQIPNLAAEAQQNVGTAQLLFKLGQTQGQLAALQEQATAEREYWKGYVAGIDQLHQAAPPAMPSPPTPRQPRPSSDNPGSPSAPTGSPPPPPAVPPTAR